MTLHLLRALLANPTYFMIKVTGRIPRLRPLLTLFNITGGVRCDLHKIQPDPDNSCICKNEISADYDLHVIVPVYNVEKYIIECMDSIVSQETQWSFLVTVVNDGSPDRSRELLRKYEQLPNVEIIDQENRGHSGARNTALRHIRGRYVMFVDSDDYLNPGAIEALMNTAKQYDCDIAQGSYRRYRGQETLEITQYKDEEHDGFMNQSFGWGKVLRAELFADICFPDGYWIEDTIFSFIIYDRARSIRTIAKQVYNYRSHDANISHSSLGNTKCLDSLYVVTRLVKDCQQLVFPNDHLHDKFLWAVPFVFKQALTLPSRNVWCEVFWRLVEIEETYFHDKHTQFEHLTSLEVALTTRDYKAFVAAVLNYRFTPPAQ